VTLSIPAGDIRVVLLEIKSFLVSKSIHWARVWKNNSPGLPKPNNRHQLVHSIADEFF